MAPEMQQKRAEFERLPQDEKPATYVFRALAVQNELVRTTPDIFKLSTSKKMLEEMLKR